MTDIKKVIDKSDFIIPMVGNKFLKHKPTKKDKQILLIPQPNNKHDPNAIAVYSKRDESLVQLGFIIKDKCALIKDNLEKIKNIKLVRSIEKNSENIYYYYVVINL